VLAALREWRRVLRVDGTLFFQVPYANPLRRLTYLPLKRIEYVVKTFLGQKPVFAAYLFTPAELRRLARQAGFAIVELIPHELPDPDTHFALFHDWPFLRARPAKPDLPGGALAKSGERSGGDRPYRLNPVGRVVKRFCQAVSPWFASTGLFAIAKALPLSEKR
ncbi:MAG: hypothetical protein Q8R32_03780, partial [bacterium]|nr:hypothetical protein [bacterium]